MTMTFRARPTGVTILGILYIIGGLIAVAGAALAGVIVGALTGIAIGAAIGGFLAVFFGIIAVIEFVIVAGLLSGKSWGRKIVIAFSIIDIVLELFTLVAGSAFAVIFIILDIIVLYYMSRPQVGEYFGAYSQVRTQQAAEKAGNCPQCGSPVKSHSNFCEKCGSKLKMCSQCSSMNAN